MKSRYLEYLSRVVEARFEHPEWRRGQTHFNVLHDMYPDIADEIRWTHIDPFYIREPIAMDNYTRFVADRLAQLDRKDNA